MNKIINIRDITLNYGQLSQPFLNYYFENFNNYDCFYYYFKAVESIFNSHHEKALYFLKKALKLNPKGYMYHLIRIKMLVIFDFMKLYSEAEILAEEIKKDINNMSKSVRNTAFIGILVHKIETNNLEDSFIKSFSPERKLYNTYSKAPWGTILVKFFLLKGEIQEAIRFSESTFKYSKKILNPSNIINSLNLLSWNLKNIDLINSYNYCEKAIYYGGYYFENISRIFNVIDTYWEIIKKFPSEKILPFSIFLKSLKSFYNNEKYKTVFNRYKNIFDEAEKLNYIDSKFEYDNDEKLSEFLKVRIKNISDFSQKSEINRSNLSNLINGKTKKVKSNTLLKIINNLNLKFSVKLPYQIYNEMGKNFVKKHEKEYMFLINNSFLKDVTYVGNIKNKDPYFFNNLEKARLDLGNIFLTSVENKDRFLNDYEKLNFYEKSLICSFARNYSRYKGIMNFKNKEIKNIFNPLILDSQTTNTSLYWYSKTVRNTIINILKKINL